MYFFQYTLNIYEDRSYSGLYRMSQILNMLSHHNRIKLEMNTRKIPRISPNIDIYQSNSTELNNA